MSESSDMLFQLLQSRNSVRGFLPDALPEDKLDRLFAMAQQAPSWCNIQPWRLAVTRPPVTQALSKILQETAKVQKPAPDIAFPADYPEPYAQRRRTCGGALYRAMDVPRDDTQGRYDAWLRNYKFFDAPHLVVVSRDVRLGEYGTLDLGIWLGFFLAAAESLGIHTCAMASVAAYPEPLRDYLAIPAEEVIVFGVAIGTMDPAVPANDARTTREDVSANLRYL